MCAFFILCAVIEKLIILNKNKTNPSIDGYPSIDGCGQTISCNCGTKNSACKVKAYWFAESSGDSADDLRFNMTDWWPYCSTFLLITFKTSKDRDFIFDLKKGFGGMKNLVVIVPMISDSEWPPSGNFV